MWHRTILISHLIRLRITREGFWQWGFSREYSNSYCSCSFEPEIIEIVQSSDKMYSNNIVNFQESSTILNTHEKNVLKLIVSTSYIYVRGSFKRFYILARRIWIISSIVQKIHVYRLFSRVIKIKIHPIDSFVLYDKSLKCLSMVRISGKA